MRILRYEVEKGLRAVLVHQKFRQVHQDFRELNQEFTSFLNFSLGFLIRPIPLNHILGPTRQVHLVYLQLIWPSIQMHF